MKRMRHLLAVECDSTMLLIVARHERSRAWEERAHHRQEVSGDARRGEKRENFWQ